MELRTWSPPFAPLLAPLPLPFVITDWPNPRGPVSAIALRTWVDPVKLALIGQDTFFGAPGQPPANLDWPNPRGPVPAIELRTWPQGFSNVRPPPVVFFPFYNFDWPNPRGPVPSTELRTWVQRASGLLVPSRMFGRVFQGQRDRADLTGSRGRGGITGSKPRTDETVQLD